MTHSDNVGRASAPNTFDGIWWSVELPNGWTGEGDEQCATFQRNIPLGALQISSARKDAGLVSDEDLKEFAGDQISRGRRLDRVDYVPFSGFSTEYLKEGFFWKEWWLRSGNLMIYVTYNVIAGTEKLEQQDVERILASLKPIPI